MVDDAEFDGEVARAARQIEDAPAGALCALKRLVRASLTASLDEHLEAEAVSIAAQADLRETQDLLTAFLRKSK